MKRRRNFEFLYYFHSGDFKIAFDNSITRKDVEKYIKGYINLYNIQKEYRYIIAYNENIEIDFNIVDITNDEYTIEIDNLYET